MKNISIILNVVLLIAVAILFYLHFAGDASGTSTSDGSSNIPSDIKIAYVHSDSLTKHYDYVKSSREIIEAKAKRLEGDFEKRRQGLANEIAAYQRNVNNMTLGQVKATEEDLGKKQQNLQMFQQRLSQEVMQDEARINKELYDRVTAYLKKYADEKGLQIVLKYDVGSDILHASNVLDVTDEVIQGLNAEYKSKDAKTDSTSVKN